jgi:NTP pyrophosphatase (non-canonical NTP hydrolase)
MMTSSLLTTIASYHGTDSQLRQLMEECAELSVECSHTIREREKNPEGDPLSPGLTEEMADVLFVIKQVMFLLGISGEELEAIMEQKAEREAGRCGLLE